MKKVIFPLLLIFVILGTTSVFCQTLNLDLKSGAQLNMGPPPTNKVRNPNFNDGNQGWNPDENGDGEMDSDIGVYENGGFWSKCQNVTDMVGLMSKIIPKNLGIPTGNPPSTTLNLLYGTHISIEKGKTYSVRFKVAADSVRIIDILCIQLFAPFDTALWIHDIQLDTILCTYGSYFLNWGQNTPTKSAKLSEINDSNTDSKVDESPSDSMVFAFAVGASLVPVYIDDVEIIETAAPEINIIQDAINVEDNTGIYDFGDVTIGESKTVSFSIQNTGTSSLNLSNTTTRVVVSSGTDFTLVKDANSLISKGNTTTFEVKFEPKTTGEAFGTISIANNDASENPFNFSIIGNGIINTAIDNIISSENLGIRVYPNPAENMLKVDISAIAGESFVAEIFDLQGHSIFITNSKAMINGIHTIEMNVQSVVDGTYFVKITINSRLIRLSKILIKK